MVTLFSISMILSLIILFATLIAYNDIIQNKNSVIRSWADLIAYEKQKNIILPKIAEVVKEYQTYEHDLQMQITELRTAIDCIKSDQLNHNMLKQIEEQTRSLIKGIKVAVENYPNLKTADLMQSFMTEIIKQQENIRAAINIFNKNIEAFNNEIQTFPGRMVNDRLNKETKLEPFIDQKTLDLFAYKLYL